MADTLKESLDRSISEMSLPDFDHKLFTNINQIDQGGSGIIYKSDFGDFKTVVLKKLRILDNDTAKEFIKEFKHHISDNCQNDIIHRQIKAILNDNLPHSQDYQIENLSRLINENSKDLGTALKFDPNDTFTLKQYAKADRLKNNTKTKFFY
ncbi:5071_t:CDS:2 [Cetraspora pellucida]|uniref:5071_t:CDS:1 n=1 Tax=Cetraspora pellucida TaxID=1433469 RepID=A0A9N9NP61_9GLOM|nr:5071_t:CDS:2 [Cetraspora pellucida]